MYFQINYYLVGPTAYDDDDANTNTNNNNNIWDGVDGEINLGMGCYINRLSLLPWVLIDEERIWMWILNTFKTNSHNGWLVMEPIHHPH